MKAKSLTRLKIRLSLLFLCCSLSRRRLVGGIGEIVTRSRPSAGSVTSGHLNDFVPVVPTARHQLLQADDRGQYQGELADDQSLAG